MVPQIDDSDGNGWVVWRAECALCPRKWVAVAPIECEALECPTCGFLNEIDRNQVVKTSSVKPPEPN